MEKKADEGVAEFVSAAALYASKEFQLAMCLSESFFAIGPPTACVNGVFVLSAPYNRG